MPPTGIKAVIFDLDETLLDRNRSLELFVRWQAGDKLRNCIGDADRFVERFIELDANGTVWKDRVYQALISEFDISGWSAEELLTEYELTFCDFVTPKDGVAEALPVIAKKYKLGLISNGMSPFQERNFQSLSISTLFSSVLVSQAVGFRKPDPRIFKLGCTQLGVETSEAVFVGDNPTADIGGAQDAGLKTIFIPGRLHSICEIADATCTAMRQLPVLLKGLDAIC